MEAKSLLSDDSGSINRSRSISPSMEIDDETETSTTGTIDGQNTTSTPTTQIN